MYSYTLILCHDGDFQQIICTFAKYPTAGNMKEVMKDGWKYEITHLEIDKFLVEKQQTVGWTQDGAYDIPVEIKLIENAFIQNW